MTWQKISISDAELMVNHPIKDAIINKPIDLEPCSQCGEQKWRMRDRYRIDPIKFNFVPKSRWHWYDNQEFFVPIDHKTIFAGAAVVCGGKDNTCDQVRSVVFDPSSDQWIGTRSFYEKNQKDSEEFKKFQDFVRKYVPNFEGMKE